MTTRAMILVAVAQGLAACSTYDPYIPEERATATLGGRTAATYPIPSDQNPLGNLRVASSGISELRQERTDQKIPAIHVRLAIANNGPATMLINVQEQRVQLPDGAQIAPVLARSHQGQTPVFEVPPGSSRVIDMLFPIPGRGDERQPPRFDVIWRVQIGPSSVVRITPFNEVQVDPAVARQEAYRNWFYGPYWYDPLWGPGRWWW